MPWKTLSSLGLLALVSACTGATTSNLNEEFGTLYQAKLQTESAPSTDPVAALVRASLETDLQTLARRAAQEARAASDPRDAISRYRLAAIAAWQGRSSDALEYSAQGTALCDALEGGPNGENGAPRDCAMLLVIPELASNDAYFERLERLQESSDGESSDGMLRPEDAEAAAEIYFGLAETYRSYHDDQLIIDGYTSAPPELQHALDAYGRSIYCNSRVAATAMIETAGESAAETQRALRLRAENEGLFLARGQPNCD